MTTVKKTKKKVEEKKPSLVEEGNFTMVLTADELISAVQILSFATDVFEKMSLDRRDIGDEKAALIYMTKSELSLILYKKFRDVARIGEPDSRSMH